MSYVIAKYLRISDEDIDLDGLKKHESNSIVNQRALLDDFINMTPEFNGCEVIEYLDDGKSGTNFIRSGVQRVIELAKTGRINCIIVKDISRLGRNYLEVGDFLEQKFPAWGVRFISIGDMYDSAKLGNATGGIDMAFRGLIAHLYSQDLSDKIRSGKDTAAKSGKIVTTYPTYGYDKDANDYHKFVINPDESTVVKRIYDLAEQGASVAEIVRMLNDDNVPTIQTSKQNKGISMKWGRGDCWGRWVVDSILRDEKYTGKWIWGKTRVVELGSKKGIPMPRSEWITIEGAIPAIITEEQFANVQEALKKHSKKKGKTKRGSIFIRKIICADCGRGMGYQTRTYGKKIGTRVFLCTMHNLSKNYDCKTGRVEESAIYDIVLEAVQAQALLAFNKIQKQKKLHEHSMSVIDTLNANIRSMQLATEKIKSSKVSLWEEYHNGAITREVFQAKSEKLSAEISAHDISISEHEEKIAKAESSSVHENMDVERHSKLTGIKELTKELVDEMVEEIRVYSPDRIEIAWKHCARENFAQVDYDFPYEGHVDTHE